MVCSLHADAGNELGDILQGRFGMTLAEARTYLLAKSAECGLTPVSEKESKEGSWCMSFYAPPPMRRRDSTKTYAPPPWDGLRALAREMGVCYDGGGDPPWEYVIKEEKAPEPGTYQPV